jgi:hypothetical protein
MMYRLPEVGDEVIDATSNSPGLRAANSNLRLVSMWMMVRHLERRFRICCCGGEP